MSIIRTIVLKMFPRLGRIIKLRDELIAENISLKLRIKELEKVVDERRNVEKADDLYVESLNACIDDFSVAVFDQRVIPGKKYNDL